MRKFFARDILDLLIEFTYLAIIFFIPIYFAVWFPTYNIFELDKLVIFKIGVLFLLGLSLIKIIFYYPLAPFLKTEFRPQNLWQRYFLAPSVFIIVLSLVWVFALNTGMSFFGSYARQEGLLSYWFYFLWLVLTVFNVISVNNIFSKSKALNHEEISGLIARNLKRIIVTITISSALVSFYGIMQFLGIDFLIWPEPPVLTHRAFSSFGQPNFLASWLLLTIPLAFYLIKIQSGTFNKFWFYLILVLQLICLFCTASRGAWLALIGTGLLFLFFYLWRSIKLSRSKKILAVFLIFILAGVLLFGLDKLSNGRLARSFNVGDGSVAAHLDFWVASGSAIKLKPLVGYGLDNYSDVFARAYKPNWAAYGNINAYSDRAHNFILDILLGGGLIGLVAWLVLFYYLFRLIRDNSQFKKVSAFLLWPGIFIFFS
ncbi:MAG: O-antigen ligase family protein [Candidatus Falkowbacteria bacterium]|nr:O-antigen ligase family protein [Candidatus Falkowbacteria bacterium]